MRLLRCWTVPVALAAILATASVVSAEDKWLEVRSPHFTVASNASDKTARDLAWQFEQIRSAVAAGWPWARVNLDRPIFVIAAKDEATMKELVPQYWETRGGSRPASVFNGALDRYYIALRADVKGDDTPGINPYISAYWSYGLLAFDASVERRLPLWFRVGMAEVLSNSIVRGDEIQYGRQIPWHIQSLLQSRLRLAEFIETETDSPYFASASTRDRFDAQAWGLMHYMLFGQANGRNDNVNRVAQLLVEGQKSAAALQQVFGSVDVLEEEYLKYEQRPITQYARLKVQRETLSKDFPSRTLPAAEVLAVRAGLHVAMGRNEDAEPLIAESRKLDPGNAMSYDVEAHLFDRAQKATEAREAYAKAVELKSQSFLSYYRLVTFAPNPMPPEVAAEAEARLRRSIELNPAFAPAHTLLAFVLLNTRRAADALAAAQTAAQLEPRDVGPRLILARALWQLGRLPEAKGIARSALALARDDRERRQSQELINELERAAN